jgi:pseudouridine-5'-phosphate glycosidase
MNEMIEEAVRAAKKEGIKGKKLTPYLLDKIKELTEGKSLKANIELIKNNARLAAKIAYELVKFSAGDSDNVHEKKYDIV